MASSTSPAVVATVLRRLPLRLLVRSGVRDVALRADHGGGPEPRPGPCGPARGQAAEDARLARSGSARTSRISVDTAHWFVAGIAGALLVNLGRGTGLPRCPPPSRAGGPLDAEGPAGIATTLRDAPDGTADTAAGDRARSRPNRADDRPSVNTHSTPPVPPCRSPVFRPPSPARKVRHPDVKVIYITVST